MSLWDKVKCKAVKEIKELPKAVKESFIQGITVEIPQTLKAYTRMGASEAAQAIVKAFPDSIGPQETTGTVGNPTQQQITQGFELYGTSPEVEPTKNSELQAEVEHEPELER